MTTVKTIDRNFQKKIVLLLLFFLNLSMLTAQTDSTRTAPVASPAASNAPQATARLPKNSSKSVIIEFLNKEVELKQSEIVSNVLKIINKSDKQLSFYIDITHPLKWKALLDKNKLYEIKTGDTLFIPIRIIPATTFKGNISYLFNVFVTTEEGKQLGNDLFFVSTKKVVKWDVSVLPKDRIYFLNDQKSVDFGFNIFNQGNENQDILLTLNEIGNNIVLQDTTGKIINKRFFNLNLPSLADTSLFYKMSYFEGARNFRVIDNETYTPKSSTEERKYTLYAQTTESKQATKNIFKTGKKVDFIKLSNQKKINPYGTSVLPLIVDANIYNVLGNQPMMNLVLKGNTMLNNGANLSYFSQFNYSSYSYSNNFINNNSWVIGYSEKRGNIQIGNVISSGIVGAAASGKGISGNYNISRKQSIGAYFIKAPVLFGRTQQVSFGLSHRLVLPKNILLSSSIGRSVNKNSGSTIDYIGSNLGFNVLNQHYFGVGGAVLSRKGGQYQPFGFLINTSYNGSYFKKKLNTTLRGSYFSKGYTSVGTERIIINHRSLYRLPSSWQIALQNNYNRYGSAFYENGTSTIIDNMTFTNQLYFSRYLKGSNLMPNIFYNITDVYKTIIHYRGIGIDYGYYNHEKNFRFTSSIKGGYNNIVNYPNMKEYFTMQLFTMFQYQNVSANVRYNYGQQAARVVDSTLGYTYPQSFYLALQHQYLFKDSRFMLQSSGNYSFSNLMFSHNIGFYPELYFFSYNGWRFKLSLGYNINITNRNKAGAFDPYKTPDKSEDLSLKPQVNQNFTMGAGVRKEFGIPIPKKYAKVRYATLKFVAFLDINGNREKDNNEVALENVVVRLNDDEVITNQLGTATLQNIKYGEYLLSVIQLEDYKGWFPLKNDSISINGDNEKYYIPFVRGVKISGDIVMDREQYAADANDALDLSKIRVTVTDSAGKAYSSLTDINGNFSIYVPSGNYVITMDETILGERFLLAQNNVDIKLEIGMEGFFYSFYVIEKKRRVNIKKAPAQEPVKKSE